MKDPFYGSHQVTTFSPLEIPIQEGDSVLKNHTVGGLKENMLTAAL